MSSTAVLGGVGPPVTAGPVRPPHPGSMTTGRMEIGLHSFGARAGGPEGHGRASTAQATRDLLELIERADQVGLDFFGIGEHHTGDTPASAASVILGAAAARTARIRLGSAVTVLSTEDPVRVHQQFATLDNISRGRAEITAGRGSSTESRCSATTWRTTTGSTPRSWTCCSR